MPWNASEEESSDNDPDVSVDQSPRTGGRELPNNKESSPKSCPLPPPAPGIPTELSSPPSTDLTIESHREPVRRLKTRRVYQSSSGKATLIWTFNSSLLPGYTLESGTKYETYRFVLKLLLFAFSKFHSRRNLGINFTRCGRIICDAITCVHVHWVQGNHEVCACSSWLNIY